MFGRKKWFVYDRFGKKHSFYEALDAVNHAVDCAVEVTNNRGRVLAEFWF